MHPLGTAIPASRTGTHPVHRGCLQAERIGMLPSEAGRFAGQLAYYEQQVGGWEDYFSGRGEAPGRWMGASRRRWGVGTRRPVKEPALHLVS